MAVLREQLETALGIEEAFAFAADFANARRWDPGVASSERLGDRQVGVGARYRLGIRMGSRVAPMEYEITRFEAPNRVRATLADLAAACGPHRPVAVARELTKAFEEMWRGTLAGAARHVERTEPRGEHVVVVGPAPERAPPGDAEIEAAVRAALADGRSARDAASDVANALGVARRRAYEAATRLKPARR